MKSLKERLWEIESFVEARQSSPERMYWKVDDASGEDFCHDCIKKELPDGEYGEDYEGGYGLESDGSRVCCKCGKLLDYTLTNYGIDYEIEHFEEYPPDLNNPDQCYEIAAIAGGIAWDDKKRIRRLLAIMKAANWDKVVA